MRGAYVDTRAVCQNYYELAFEGLNRIILRLIFSISSSIFLSIQNVMSKVIIGV